MAERIEEASRVEEAYAICVERRRQRWAGAPDRAERARWRHMWREAIDQHEAAKTRLDQLLELAGA